MYKLVSVDLVKNIITLDKFIDIPSYHFSHLVYNHYLKNFGCLLLIPEQFVIAEFERLQADSPDSINDTIYFLVVKKYDLLL